MWAQTCDATHELLLKLYYVTPTPLSSPSNHVNSSERSVLINRSQRRLFFASSYCAGMSKPEESALLSPITLVLINTTLMPPLFSEPLQNKGLRMGGWQERSSDFHIFVFTRGNCHRWGEDGKTISCSLALRRKWKTRQHRKKDLPVLQSKTFGWVDVLINKSTDTESAAPAAHTHTHINYIQNE